MRVVVDRFVLFVFLAPPTPSPFPFSFFSFLFLSFRKWSRFDVSVLVVRRVLERWRVLTPAIMRTYVCVRTARSGWYLKSPR